MHDSFIRATWLSSYCTCKIVLPLPNFHMILFSCIHTSHMHDSYICAKRLIYYYARKIVVSLPNFQVFHHIYMCIFCTCVTYSHVRYDFFITVYTNSWFLCPLPSAIICLHVHISHMHDALACATWIDHCSHELEIPLSFFQVLLYLCMHFYMYLTVSYMRYDCFIIVQTNL